MRWRLKALLLSLLLGGAWRIKEYRAWMPLSGYRVDAQTPVLEERLWSLFPQRCLSFWPWLLRDAKGLEEFMERDSPVQVSTRMPRFGHFETTIRWLTPWLKVEWQGRVWCVSKEGRMWDASEFSDPVFDRVLNGPVWRVGQIEEGPQAPPSGVFASLLPTEVIAAFQEEYQGYPWFQSVKEAVWDRRAGMDLFRLKLERGGQNFEVLIQSAKYAGQDLGVALEEVLNRLSREGGDHRIDATYEGKILLRSLAGNSNGPKEGSK